jgi:hypothetical protein
MAIMNGIVPNSDRVAILQRSMKYSKATVQRMAAMQAALELVDDQGVEGDVVECGVWHGGHLIMARLVSPHRHCWAYDTFTGMTEPGPYDITRGGRPALPKYRIIEEANKPWMTASLEQVQSNFIAEGVLDRVRFIVGDVIKTLRDPANLPDKIALLRLDTDWYESTKVEMEVLYPRLVEGGILIIDDYGHWLGARKAVQEYFSANGWSAQKLRPIDYSAVMMVKGI